MSKREDQAFAAWAEEFKTEYLKGDEDAVEAFEALMSSEAGRELYRGNLREKDYYTRLNKLAAEKDELKAAQDELAEWLENEEPIREQIKKERDELKAQLAKGTVGDNPPSQVAGISPEEFALIRAKASKVDVIDKILPQVIGDLGAVLQDAWKNNYDVDAREIMQTSIQQGIDPYRAYGLLTEKQRQERAKVAAEEERKRWFEEGRQAALSGEAPDHLQPSGPSMFDILSESNSSAQNEIAGRVPSAATESRARVGDAVRQFREGNF